MALALNEEHSAATRRTRACSIERRTLVLICEIVPPKLRTSGSSTRLHRGRGRERSDCVAEFAPGHVVERGHQRRLIDIAEPLGGGLGQIQPVVPIAQRILQPLQLAMNWAASADFGANSAA